MKTVAVLRNYFGQLPGESVKEFADELKALTVDEKRELAELAAKELGVVLED